VRIALTFVVRWGASVAISLGSKRTCQWLGLPALSPMSCAGALPPLCTTSATVVARPTEASPESSPVGVLSVSCGEPETTSVSGSSARASAAPR
jgi:hypothetical protein